MRQKNSKTKMVVLKTMENILIVLSIGIAGFFMHLAFRNNAFEIFVPSGSSIFWPLSASSFKSIFLYYFLGTFEIIIIASFTLLNLFECRLSIILRKFFRFTLFCSFYILCYISIGMIFRKLKYGAITDIPGSDIPVPFTLSLIAFITIAVFIFVNRKKI